MGIMDYENVEEGMSDSSNEHRLSGAESWSEPSSSSSESESEEEEEESDEEEEEEESWNACASTRSGGRNKSVVRQTWQKLCRRFLDSLSTRPEAEPFQAAVDPIMYPDYYTVVDTPMDLGTVREQLVAGIYGNLREFRKDVDLIFQNSKIYNTDRRSNIFTMTVKMENLCRKKLDEIARESKRPESVKKPNRKAGEAATSCSSSSRKPAKQVQHKRTVKKCVKRRPTSSPDPTQPGPSGLCGSNGVPASWPALVASESDATEIEENDAHDTDATEIVENEPLPQQASQEQSAKRKKPVARAKASMKRVKREEPSDATEEEEENEDEEASSYRTASRSSTVTTASTSGSLSEEHERRRKRVSYVGKGKYPAKVAPRTRNGGVARVSYACLNNDDDDDDASDDSDFDYGIERRLQGNGRRFSSRGRLIKFKGQARNAGQVC